MRKGGGIMHAGLNAFTQALSDFCRENVLAEKWLLAPSLRVGFQWLDAVTRSGRPVLNVRVKTVQHLALDLAGPEMDRRRVTFLRTCRAEVLMDRIVGRLRADRSGYLSELNPSPGLIRTLLAAVRDLRLAGLSTGDLRESAFEVAPKASEVRALLSEYEEELAQSNLADYADVLRMASARVGEAGTALPDGALVLIPQDAEENLKGLERTFWDALPPRARKVLPVDQPRAAPDGDLSDLDLLRWISAPGDAPAPKRDGAARLFRAVGEVNEVREVLRRCMEQKLAFDEVEIIHTDAQTYVPVVFEVAARLMPEGIETLPVTFGEGVPVRYSRPGRALAAWLAWIREGFPQATLVRMIQDGLVQVPGASDAGFSSARLGAILRAVKIGAGADRCLGAIDAERNALAARIRRLHARHADDGAAGSGSRVADLEQRLAGLKRLRPVVADLLTISPRENRDPRTTLAHAEQFVATHARCVSQLDAYGRRKLLDEIRELRDSLEEEDVAAGLDVWDWLAGLPGEARVCGQGPRPGCLFVSNLDRGGHSGRRHTFIVGLDDARFPGAGLQDPLLLDRERHGLSGDLPTAAARLARRLESFERLLARLRGTVTMSFCCRDLAEDRDMFPSGILLSAYRILSGSPEGDQEAMLKWGELVAPASFAPAHEGRGSTPQAGGSGACAPGEACRTRRNSSARVSRISDVDFAPARRGRAIASPNTTVMFRRPDAISTRRGRTAPSSLRAGWRPWAPAPWSTSSGTFSTSRPRTTMTSIPTSGSIPLKRVHFSTPCSATS